jgi:porphobilinogen synthase
MMDGRVGAIRKALDKKKFYDVSILSYAIKYASNFYGPFRDAVGSKSKLKKNKKTYQMDFRNKLESFREVGLDIKEGADLVMIKPGMFYLDIISNIKNKFNIPVIVYQVSGEYSLLKNAIRNKILSEDAMIESIISFKRSGASAIVTYFALEIAKKIKQIN